MSSGSNPDPSVTPGGPPEASVAAEKKREKALRNLAIDANREAMLGPMSTFTGAEVAPPPKKKAKKTLEVILLSSESDTDSDEEHKKNKKEEQENMKKGFIEYLMRDSIHCMAKLISNDGRNKEKKEAYVFDLLEENADYICDGSFHYNYVGKKHTDFLSGYVYAAEQAALDACRALCRAKKWEIEELLDFMRRNKKKWSKKNKVLHMNFAAMTKIKWK